jgi:hypothetical protein
VRSPKERHHLEDEGVDGIRIYVREIRCGVEWIQLAQYRDRCRDLVKTVMNLRFLAPPNYFSSNLQR